MIESSKIAIVILNWNGEKLFEKFLPSVIKNAGNADIIVADNGSSDHSVSFLKNNFPQVQVLSLGKNYGFAEGYNRALQQINAEYFVILNSDVEVTPNWLDKCIQIFQKNPKVAAVQPKILSYEKPHLFEYAGAAGGFIDKFGYPFCRGRILNVTEPDLGQYDQILNIFWASGACMVIKADAFNKAGGFDKDFWAHMEEIDLCWRLKSLDYEIRYQPESVVFHLGGGTLSYGSPQKIFLNFRNNLSMLFKNLPKKHFTRIMIARLILDGIAALKFAAGFNLKAFAAILRAHIHFYKNLPDLISKRKKTQKDSTIISHAEIYPKSIMWQFFMRKKQKYSSLLFNPAKNAKN